MSPLHVFHVAVRVAAIVLATSTVFALLIGNVIHEKERNR